MDDLSMRALHASWALGFGTRVGSHVSADEAAARLRATRARPRRWTWRPALPRLGFSIELQIAWLRLVYR